MTIREARNEEEKLGNELELYLEKKKINFNKTQPGSIKYQDIVTHSNILIDKFTHYVIKDVELDEHILALQEEINSLEKYIIEEMKRISKSPDSTEQIKFYRDELKMSWEEIAKRVHYSTRQVIRIYKGKS